MEHPSIEKYNKFSGDTFLGCEAFGVNFIDLDDKSKNNLEL